MKPLLERLRGARHIEWFAALVLLTLLALALTGGRAALSPKNQGSSLERRLEAILSRIDGVGRVSVMIAEDEQGTPVGAVIVAEGLTEVRPALEVQAAVRTLLGIEENRIRVIGRHGSFGGAQG